LKIGILSDAHGNSQALTLCLNFLNKQKVGRIFFLGDAFGYLPDTSANKVLVKQKIFCLLGNHDAMLLDIIKPGSPAADVYGFDNLRRAISKKELAELSTRVPYYSCSLNGKKLLFLHGSPWDPLNGYIYPDHPLKNFTKLPHDVIFMGHTHRPFVKRLAKKTIVNVGSCGIPRDQGNLASCAIYDTKANHVELIRIPFDEQKIINKYHGRLHREVINCLLRKSNSPIAGKVIVPC